MKQIYLKEFEEAKTKSSDSERLSYLSSIMRSMLQSFALPAIEIVLSMTPSKESGFNCKGLLDRFSQPSDGLPLEALDALIPVVRSHVSKTYMVGWFENTHGANEPIVAELLEWVEFRNRMPAHGVLDSKNTSAWAERLTALIARLLATFPNGLPTAGADGSLTIEVGDSILPLTVPLVFFGHAIVIGKVVARKGSWKIYGQLLSWSDAKEITIDLGAANIFSSSDVGIEKFRLSEIPGDSPVKSIFNNIPVRQTPTFVGRKKELDKLHEWMQDVTDSRTCLVYGDGGFGKTTLVLEFLNNLLEGKVEVSCPLPAVISFYTAKKTKWTDEGLVHFKGISDAMEDSVRELLYFFYPVLGKEWYKSDGYPLIDKIAGEFSTQGFSRNDILLIIDNTETLATSTLDAEELADFLARVGKKLGRVIITSRRRELLAATPVAVSSLSESEALMLIQRLGNEYKAQSVIQAGESRLRGVCGQLMNKPLLIDTLVRYISRSSSGIQEGLDQILKKTNDELLEFLYEDAWARMNELVRQVFMVLVSLANPLNGKCIGDACTEIGVQHAEFQSSLGETYFASIIDHGDSYDLEIVELAKEFFRQKKRRATVPEAERLNNIAFKVDKLATDRSKVEQLYRQDRVADGFRSEYAKAAKIAGMKRDYKGAVENFELALLDEPLNASLRERFASFLLRTLNRVEDALPHALEATRLDSQNGDAWLTLALVRYKLNHLVDGDLAIDNALSHGKPEALCLLQKAIARYHNARREPYSRTSLKKLKEAEMLLDRHFRTADPKDFYYRKNSESATKYSGLVRTLISGINSRAATSENAPE